MWTHRSMDISGCSRTNPNLNLTLTNSKLALTMIRPWAHEFVDTSVRGLYDRRLRRCWIFVHTYDRGGFVVEGHFHLLMNDRQTFVPWKEIYETALSLKITSTDNERFSGLPWNLSVKRLCDRGWLWRLIFVSQTSCGFSVKDLKLIQWW